MSGHLSLFEGETKQSSETADEAYSALLSAALSEVRDVVLILLEPLPKHSPEAAAAFACDIAELALPILEAATPGEARPRQALEMVRAFLAGEADGEEVRRASLGLLDLSKSLPTRSLERFALQACEHSCWVRKRDSAAAARPASVAWAVVDAIADTAYRVDDQAELRAWLRVRWLLADIVAGPGAEGMDLVRGSTPETKGGAL